MNILFFTKPRLSFLLLLSILLFGCSQLPISQLPSDNYNDRVRFLVIHFTTIDFQDSVRALTKGGVSSHYLIPENDDNSYTDSNLKTFQLVDESKRAWHAGRSFWQGQNNLNDQSIGIELVYQSNCHKEKLTSDTQAVAANRFDGLNIEAKSDRICFYPDFDPEQIEQLILLVKDIIKRNPEITPDRIIGHADITPDRRVDPGPKFPWHQLYKAGIGAWYEQQKVTKYWQLFRQNEPTVQLIQSALRAYGYGVLETGQLDSQTINALTVFQMHFRPWQVDGKPTAETAATLFALIDKYRNKKLAKLLQRLDVETNLTARLEDQVYAGQFDGRYPKKDPSTRELVNQRHLFKAYSGHGQLIVNNHNASSLELYINGKKLDFGERLKENQIATLDIGQYTSSGYNTLRLNKIYPKGAKLTIEVPFPTLSPMNNKAAQAAFSKKKLAKVDQLISKEIAEGFPGATLLVAHKGQIIKHQAFGFSSRYDREGLELTQPTKMLTSTLFDLASNTKMYATNYAVMKLVSEKKLNVNLPISHYLPDYRGEGRESRLVKDLLNHTAGYQPAVDFHSQENNLGTKFFSQQKYKTQQLLVKSVPFKTGRNLKSVYSDVDYMLLGTLIERITHMPLDVFVEDHIYRPLGLQNTVFNPLKKGYNKTQIAATELQGNTRQSKVEFDNIRTDVIHGEVHDEKAFYSMQGVAGHAGLFSNAKETAILASVLLNRGGYGKHRFFNMSQIDQFVTPSHLDITMGLGWRRAGNGERKWQFGPYASPYAVGHTGWTGTVTIVDPFYDLIIVLLTNKKHTKMVAKQENGVITEQMEFRGDTFETGKYGSIITLVYEAMLENK